MAIKKYLPVLMLFSVLIFLFGMSLAPKKKMNRQTQRIFLQVVVEDTLEDIEYAYASKDLNDFFALLDKGFEGGQRFKPVLEAYLRLISKPFIHFSIDMIVADKNEVSVRVHWQRRGVTGSGVVIKSQGKSQLQFKRCPEGLKLKRIDKDNPFF
ncbi:MAG: hypothetical protein V1869_06670 [Candidatus Omnitrophota bacterium]